MHTSRWRYRRYQRALHQALIDNRDAVFEALTNEKLPALDLELAKFLLNEAGWDKYDFMISYVMGELDD